MMKRYSQISFILGILVFVTGVQPIWADTTSISIKIGEGSGGGYSYSGIHTADSCSNNLCMGGTKLYWPFSGSLTADFDDTALSLNNIHGILTTPSNGSMKVTGGSLITTSPGGNASGSFSYILTGDLEESGMFHFVGSQMCCSGAINGGPNNLTASGFTLWGNNWDVTTGGTKNSVSGTPLGIDLVGGHYTTTPEPSTMMLLGSGLLALPFLRKKKR